MVLKLGEIAMNKALQINIPEEHDTTTTLKALEKVYIEHVFKLSKYNQSKAAAALGLSRGGLRGKLKEHFGDQYL